MTLPDWAVLDTAWRPARAAGVLGSATTEEIVAHAAGYLPAACRVQDEFTGIDLGTGAGVPGVVLAALRPRSHWLLVDASARRCEYAQAAVRSLGLSERVTVTHARAEDIAHDPIRRGSFDLVVARSFGPPEELAECGLPLVADGGALVVSVTAATTKRWTSAVDALDLLVGTHSIDDTGQFAVIRPRRPVPASWPRRAATRRRAPLF